MAERNHQKIADRVEATDDDPFAELTRIMGFDPRQPAPARPQPPAPPVVAADDQPSYDPSFHIDLEKELMGEFGDDEEPQQRQAAPSWATLRDEPQAAQAPADDFEIEFDDTFEEDEPLPMETARSWAEPAPEPVAAVAEDLDLAFDEAFDGEQPRVVEPAHSWAAPEPEPVALEADDVELSFEDTFEDNEPHLIRTEEAWAVPQPEAGEANADDVELTFDDAFEDNEAQPVEAAWTTHEAELPDLEAAADDLELTFEDAIEEDEEQPLAAAPSWTAPEAYAPLQAAETPDIDLAFDDALATSFEEHAEDKIETQAVGDVELEFDDEPAAEAEPDHFWMRDPEPAAPTLSYATPTVARSEDDDLALSFDEALADVDMDFEAHNAVSDDVEMDEEELSESDTELLSGEEVYPAEEIAYDHRYAPQPEPVEYEASDLDADPLESDEVELELEPEPVHYADEDDALFAAPVAVSAEVDEVDASPAAATEFDLEQELNALLGNRPLKPAYEVSPREEARPVAAAPAVADDWGLDSEDLLAETALEDEAVEATAYADDGYADEAVEATPAEAEFDLDAFDAAMAQEFASEDLIGDLSLDDDMPVQHATPAKQVPLHAAAASASYAAPAAVSYSRANTVAAPVQSEPVAEDEIGEIDFEFSPAAFDEMPDIETVDVSDQAVALADDLELPEFVFEEEVTPVAAYDDLDHEFSSLISEMNTNEPAKARTGYDDDFSAAPVYAAAAAAAGYAGARATAKATHPAYEEDVAQNRYELGGYDPNDGRAGQANYAADDLDYDPELDEEISLSDGAAPRERAPRQRRGMMLAAIVGGVAIIGGVGAFALSLGNGPSSDAPVIVKADQAPIKVKPEAPGGAVVPNQDNKVYDSVAGDRSAKEPQQTKLVTTTEEPVDVTPPPPEQPSLDLAAAEDPAEAAVTPKGEDRIEQVIGENAGKSDSEIAAVAPRKVRTMVVKPDGTLVPREDPAPVEAVAPANETVASVDPEPAADMATGSTSPVAAAEPAQPAQAAPAVESAAALKPVVKPQASTMPNSVPLAPQRPAEQPIDVVGEVKPDQVAAISPSPTAAAAGGSWSMQIASQPSEAAAQASYQDLTRRYGSVLNGRQANIVKAEIAGKGTFWRVRVPAQSRNDAVALCESYKAAGGNCFVSR